MWSHSLCLLDTFIEHLLCPITGDVEVTDTSRAPAHGAYSECWKSEDEQTSFLGAVKGRMWPQGRTELRSAVRWWVVRGCDGMVSAKPSLEEQTRWKERQVPAPWGTKLTRGEGCFDGRGAPRPRERWVARVLENMCSEPVCLWPRSRESQNTCVCVCVCVCVRKRERDFSRSVVSSS